MEFASLKSFSTPPLKASAQDNHQQGLRLYADGQYEQAASFLQRALQDEATSERANDCAAAHLACGNKENALANFLLAAEMDAENMEAAANLGILLASLGRFQEAIPYLQESAHRAADASQRPALTQLLVLCGNKVAEHTLRESRAAQDRANAAHGLPAIPSQPAVAPTLRPPVYMGNNRALLCTTNHCKMYVDTTDPVGLPQVPPLTFTSSLPATLVWNPGTILSLLPSCAPVPLCPQRRFAFALVSAGRASQTNRNDNE
jgi:tetratricopeptide (TPR) repeat protein